MKRVFSNVSYILFPLLFSIIFPSYNLFCLLLLLIILYLEKNKSNNYLIGFILGLTFLTKQNIGLALCIPSIFIKNHKKIIKRIIGFLIPNLIFLIYLIATNSFFEFIDYTFLGLRDFSQQNNKINKLIIINIILSIYLLIKYFKTKDISILYILFFQIIGYPLADKYHLTLSIIPLLGYLLADIKLKNSLIKLFSILFTVLYCSASIFCIFKNQYILPNETNVFKYKPLKYDMVNHIVQVSSYFKKIKGNKYIISKSAYIYKLEANITIDKYDLLNKGNMGKNGNKKIVEEFNNRCAKEKCTFLVNPYEKGCLDEEITKYVLTNYQPKDQINGFLVLTN